MATTRKNVPPSKNQNKKRGSTTISKALTSKSKSLATNKGVPKKQASSRPPLANKNNRQGRAAQKSRTSKNRLGMERDFEREHQESSGQRGRQSAGALRQGRQGSSGSHGRLSDFENERMERARPERLSGRHEEDQGYRAGQGVRSQRSKRDFDEGRGQPQRGHQQDMGYQQGYGQKTAQRGGQREIRARDSYIESGFEEDFDEGARGRRGQRQPQSQMNVRSRSNFETDEGQDFDVEARGRRGQRQTQSQVGMRSSDSTRDSHGNEWEEGRMSSRSHKNFGKEDKDEPRRTASRRSPPTRSKKERIH